jgi:hypothetical protein
MLELMYASGLRVTELVTLKTFNLSLNDNVLARAGQGQQGAPGAVWRGGQPVAARYLGAARGRTAGGQTDGRPVRHGTGCGSRHDVARDVLDDREETRFCRRHSGAAVTPHAAPCVCHPPAQPWCRPAGGAAAAGSCRHFDHHHLHPCGARALKALHAQHHPRQQKLPYDPVRQFTYIGQISQGSYIAATRLDHPAKDLKEWVAWARANAGKVNFASGGAGTSTHLNGELMNQATGLDVTHVPYKGSAPAVQDLLGGQTQLLIDAGSVLLPQIKGGKLKALAVTGPKRDPQLPDVPTVRELGLGAMESVGFQGLVGPAGLPRDVVDRIAATSTP